jgi:hypothetical protein
MISNALGLKIKKIEGIARTETLISLEESFSRQLKI